MPTIRRLFAAACLAVPLAATAQVPQLLNYQGRVAVEGVNFDGTGQFKFALVDGGTNVSRTATGTVTVTSGFITAATVTDGGAGYQELPRVTVRDQKGGGSGAKITATVSGGAVTALAVTDAGSGYTPLAWIEITAPPPNIVYQTYWASAPDTSPADGEPDAAVSLAVTKGLYSVLLGDATRPNMAAMPATVFSNPDVRLRVWFDDGSHGFQQLTPDARIAAVGYALMAGTVPDGAIGTEKIAAGAVTSGKIATGAVDTSQLAAGAVTGGKIASGAVGSSQLAGGAVQSTNIAAGAVTSTQLAKPPRSGGVLSTSLHFQFGQAPFTVVFPTPFATAPVVTLAIRSGSTLAWQPSLWVTSSAVGGFSGQFSVPPVFAVPDGTGSVGTFPSLAEINSSPAVAYFDVLNSDLKFVRATNDSGTAWGAPLTLDSTGNVGQYASMATVSALPAVSYYDGSNGDLKFVRANNASGTAWGTPLTVDSTGIVGQYTSLKVVSGNPASAYYDLTNADLKFVRATNASGTAWDTPITIDSTGNTGQFASLAVVNGNPAIAYYDATNADLKFVRATNASGTAWGAPLILDSAGTVGKYTSLAVVNGNPAVAYFDSANGSLKFVRATNASGTSWGAPMILDTEGVDGYDACLAVVNGKPGIAYNKFDSIGCDLKFIRATDASGASWGPPLTLDAEGNVGWYPSLAMIGTTPCIAYYDQTNSDLKFVRSPELPSSFQIDWIALEP